MSIRLRLTLLYSTILALTLILFSAVLYTIQAQYTLNILERDLARAARGMALMARTRFDPVDRRWSLVPGAPRGDRGNMMWPELRDLRTRDTMRLLATDGSPLGLAMNDQDDIELPLSSKGLEQLVQPGTDLRPVGVCAESEPLGLR